MVTGSQTLLLSLLIFFAGSVFSADGEENSFADIAGSHTSCAEDTSRQAISQDKINKLLEAHEGALKKNPTAILDLSNKLMQNISFKGQIARVNFSCSDLSDSKFIKTTILFSSFYRANLSRSNFENAYIAQADFEDANLQDGSFANTEFSSTTFKGTQFFGSDFSNAKLAANDFHSANLFGGTFINTDFSDGDFTMAHLTGGKYQEADFSRADFTSADFSEGIYANNNFSDARFAFADLSKSDFREATFRRANFHYSFVAGSEFSGSKLENAKDLSTLLIGQGRDYYPTGLLQLREDLWKSGYQEEARELTYLFKHQDSNLINVIAFEYTTQWGRQPARALYLAIAITLVMGLVYWIGILNNAQLFIVRSPVSEDVDQDNDIPLGSIIAEKSSGDLARYHIECFTKALYYSLVTSTNIGWRDLNIGNWIIRIQAEPYTFKSRGWLRTVSGIHSLICIYLIAIWALTEFSLFFDW